MLLPYPRLLASLTTAIALALPFCAVAQSGNFGLELNSIQDTNGACRVTFVATNNTGVDLTEVGYEVVVWDALGSIPDNGFLVFEFGQMPVAKTKVVQFDIPDRSCNDISRILINDQTQCRSASGDHDFCTTNLLANSRSTVRFGK